MRIVVVDFAASTGGATSILTSFYDFLVRSGDRNEWIFFLSDDYIRQTPNIKVIKLLKEKKSRIRRLAFDRIYGKKIISELSPDVVFYLQNTLIHGVAVPQIMYMDQSLSFQTEKRFSFLKRDERKYAMYQHVIGKLNHAACKNADYTIVQTEWLKNAIVNQCKIANSRVIKISPNVSLKCENYHAVNVSNKVFFYPASNAVYKNHKCIFDALSQLREKCSVVLTIPKCESVPEQCECVGTLPQEAVYEQMEKSVLIFPSYIESFGLPLLEAMRIGTIILAADTLFAREILSDYENAYFFKTFCAEELAILMDRVISGEIKLIPQEKTSVENRTDAWESVVQIITGVGKQ